MSVVALRVFLFAVLPLLLAAGHIRIDGGAATSARRLEVAFLYLMALGVAGSGIGSFFAHVFLSDAVAESIGWPTGSPFQLEVGFANLAIGLLGILAMTRRDGFREATVIAVAVFGVGATAVHVIDIARPALRHPGLPRLARRRHATAATMTACICAGFSVGYGVGAPVEGALTGIACGAVLASILRARHH